MNNILIIVALIVVFFIGVISPRLAGKIQRKTDEKAGWLKRMANWLWDPITWWAKKSIELTRKLIKKDAQAGKETHKEVSDKK
jgi:hypothetical protein